MTTLLPYCPELSIVILVIAVAVLVALWWGVVTAFCLYIVS